MKEGNVGDGNNVRIFDTTLRDGEQAPGIALTRAEKVEIAEQLARLNVDILEAGFPVSSDGEFDAVAEIASSVRGPVIAALARTTEGDIVRAAEALKGAEDWRIHTFISTSRIHMASATRMLRRRGSASRYWSGSSSGRGHDSIFAMRSMPKQYCQRSA